MRSNITQLSGSPNHRTRSALLRCGTRATSPGRLKQAKQGRWVLSSLWRCLRGRRESGQVVEGLLDGRWYRWCCGEVCTLGLESAFVVGGVRQGDEVPVGVCVRVTTPGNHHVPFGTFLKCALLLTFDTVRCLVTVDKKGNSVR